MAEIKEIGRTLKTLKFKNSKNVQQIPESSSLISRACHGYVKKGTQLGEFFHVHPFKWNNELDGPELLEKGWRLNMWYFNSFITFSYYIFVVGRAVQTNLDENSSPVMKIYTKFTCVYYVSSSIAQIAYIMKKDTFPLVAQQYMMLGRTMKCKREFQIHKI